MKAKDYAAMFNDLLERSGSEAAICETFTAFVKEGMELKEARHAQTGTAAVAILRELDQKWRAVARLVPGLSPEGYRDFVKYVDPATHAAIWGKKER